MSEKKTSYKSALRLVLGIVIFVSLIALIGDAKDFARLLEVDWYWVGIVVALTFIINILASWRWHLLLKSLSDKSDVFSILRFFIMGRAVGHSTSMVAGDLGSRYVYFTSRDIGFKDGALTILVDKFLEGLLFLCVGVVFVAVIALGGTDGLMLFPVAFSVVIFFAAMWVMPGLLSLTGKFLPNKVGRLISNEDGENRLNSIVTGNNRFILFLFTVGKYVTSTFRFFVIMKICGIGLPFAAVFLGTSAAQLGLVLGLTPGGLGFVEAGWAGALHYLGIGASLTATFLLTQRILIYVSVMVLAFFCLIYELLFRKSVQGSSETDEKVIGTGDETR